MAMETDRRDILVVCAHAREAAAVAARMKRCERRHFGMFKGFLGTLGARTAAVLISGEGRDLSGAAVRQGVVLFAPSVAVNFGVAGSVDEGIRVGDVAFVSECCLYYCPPVLTTNAREDETFLYPSDELRREVTEAPTLRATDALTVSALASLSVRRSRHLTQRDVHAVRCATGDRPLERWGTKEFVAERWRARIVDMECHGFLAACAATEVRALVAKVASDDCSADAHSEFERHARHCLAVGAEALETAVAGLTL